MAVSASEWFILLSEDEAAQVRKEYDAFQTLDPRKLDDGRFILGMGVLEEPVFASQIPFLATRPLCRLVEIEGVLKVRNNSEKPGDSATLERTYVPLDPDNPLSSPQKLPERGDWSEAALHESVGRALTRWEAMEYELSKLFTAFLSPSMDSMPAERAYGAINTFNARLDMLTATAAAYFARYSKADAERGQTLQAAFDDISDKALKLNTQRNRIAHGMVGEFTSPAGHVRGVTLLPAYYANKNRALTERGTTRPEFAYTSGVINYFGEQFWRLRMPISGLWAEIHQHFVFEEGEAP